MNRALHLAVKAAAAAAFVVCVETWFQGRRRQRGTPPKITITDR
jgi:hypothetical protein